jgi:predicted glycosyltransferase
MTCFRLPSVVKVGNGRYVADDQAASLAKVLRERSDMLEQTVRDFRPDLLLVDRYPRGMHDELARALGVYAVEQPGAPAVLGLRDILDHPHTIRREWHAQRNSRTIRDTYEIVLCYGDRSIYDPIREYGLPADVAERIRFTGYLADELLAVDRLELRRRHGVRDGRLAVCTLGGGKDAAFIAHSFISAIERLGRHGWSGVLITGPYMASEDVDLLRQATGVSVLRMVDDVPNYLAAADAIVCMGGYNTICEVLALAVPAVIIPRVQPRQEQLIRADRLGALGLVQWIHPSSLSPRLLAENIAELAEQSRAEVAARIRTIDWHGVQNSARHLAALLPAPVRADVTRGCRLSERESNAWVADGPG